MSATTDSAQNALTFIVNTVVACQQRGGYSLDEAVQIDAAKRYFEKRDRGASDDATRGTHHLSMLVRLLEKSQSLGKLSLEEAWTAYNAIQIFTSRPTPPTADATVTNRAEKGAPVVDDS